jgi:hypothetical protein
MRSARSLFVVVAASLAVLTLAERGSGPRTR